MKRFLSYRVAVGAALVALALVAVYAFRDAPIDNDTRMHQALLDTHFVSPYSLNRWGGPDGETRRWIAAGIHPWHTHPDFYLVEVRPLWSRAVTLTYSVFGRQPLPYYLISLACFLGFVAILWVWLKRLVPVELATLAICIYALDGLHAESAVWFASLHSIIGGALALLGLIAHLRWRQGWKPGVLIAIGLWGIALALSETTLSAFAFVLGFEIVGHPGRPRSVRAVLPAAALSLILLALLKHAGVGTRLNPGYADPFGDPRQYLSVAVSNLRWYFEACFGGAGTWVAAALGVVTLPLFWTGMRTRSHEERRNIWGLFLGSILSLIPVMGVIQEPPEPGMYGGVRVLLYLTIGLAVFWAVALRQAIAVAARAGASLWSRIAGGAVTLVLIANLFVWSPMRFVKLVHYWFCADDDSTTVEVLARVPQTCRDATSIVWLRGPLALRLFAQYHHLAERLGWPPSDVGRQLTLAPAGPDPLTLTRTGPSTIELRTDHGPLMQFQLNVPTLLPPGPIQVPGAEIRVLDVVETRPSRIEVSFSGELTTRCFVTQTPDGNVTLVTLPTIGTSIQL